MANDCYVSGVTRESDPSRKPALLAQTLEYLLDKPLTSLSFRTLAKALDVSTFTLVYHFGSRAEMLSDIVWAISARVKDVAFTTDEGLPSIDAYFAGLDMSWNWSIQPRNRQLQRLEFEASMMEAHDPSSHTFTRSLHAHWQQRGADALQSFGVAEDDAQVETRLLVDSFFGLQYDLVINQDVERATQAFARLVQGHRARLESLIQQGAAV